MVSRQKEGCEPFRAPGHAFEARTAHGRPRYGLAGYAGALQATLRSHGKGREGDRLRARTDCRSHTGWGRDDAWPPSGGAFTSPPECHSPANLKEKGR